MICENDGTSFAAVDSIIMGALFMPLLIVNATILCSRAFIPTPQSRTFQQSHLRRIVTGRNESNESLCETTCQEESTTYLDRRTLLSSILTAGTIATLPTPTHATMTKDSEWPLWTALPVAPYSRRKTIVRHVGPGVYVFDQLIGIYYVHVPIRMTVCALDDGLFVYAPVAPTRECLTLLQPLIDDYGPVKYIVLPSVAVEHKVNAGPFARAFPEAEFYVVDKQYAFPINLPGVTLGLPSWTRLLPESSSSSSGMWNNELQHEVLTVKPGPGSEFQEAAFYHKKSKTMLLCDTLVAVNEEPPPILTQEPEYTRALLFHARDSPLEVVQDSPEARRKGWRRIVLLFNFFFPGAARANLGLEPILALRPYTLGWGGWMPFAWKSQEDELKSFQIYSNGGKATIFPIIQVILARGNSGQATQAWVDKVSQWDFERVVPAHLDAPLAMSPNEFRSNFDFLRKGVNEVRFCDEDAAFLRSAEEGFLNFSVYESKLGPLQSRIKCGLV